MSEIIKRGFVAWRLAICWACLFALSSLASAIIGALSGAEWAELKPQARLLIILSVLVNFANTMMAFISKASSKISSGQLPFEDTTTFKKA